LSENIYIATRKIAFILNNIQHYQETDNLVDNLLVSIVRSVSNEFLVPGETMHVVQSPTQEFQITKLDKAQAGEELSMGTNITIPYVVLNSNYNTKYLNAVFMLRNSTAAWINYIKDDKFVTGISGD
jgi:hypothetical protein